MFVALPHDAMGLTAVCDCGISLSYSLFSAKSYKNAFYRYMEDKERLSFSFIK